MDSTVHAAGWKLSHNVSWANIEYDEGILTINAQHIQPPRIALQNCRHCVTAFTVSAQEGYILMALLPRNRETKPFRLRSSGCQR